MISNLDPWLLDRSAESGPRIESPNEGMVRVVLAGHLGLFENLETLMTSGRLLKDEPGIEFHLFGTGAAIQQIERHIVADEPANMYLHQYLRAHEVPEFLRAKADPDIISLIQGVMRAKYARKTTSYLHHGFAVFALVEADDGLANMLTAAAAGLHTDPEDPTEVAVTVRRLAGSHSTLRIAYRRTKDLCGSEFSAGRQVDSGTRSLAYVIRRVAA